VAGTSVVPHWLSSHGEPLGNGGLLWHAGSEILGEAAAALAATYLSMGGGDDYLSVAEEVYAFGTGAGKGSYKNATNLGVLQQQLLTPTTVPPPPPSTHP
jgi:hypothetical protein